MTQRLSTILTTLPCLFVTLAVAHGQVPSALAGPKALPFSGTVHYDLHYSQNAEFGSNLGDWQTAIASGDAAYANISRRLPFSMDYSGGYTWTLQGPAYSTGLFQHLFLSQGFVLGRWSALASDDASYRPQAPTTGFSGIPGIGEPIGIPSPAPPSGQSILTLNTHVADNTVAGNLSRMLNFAWSLTGGGSWNLLRYPDGNGIDSDSTMANGALTRRLNARDSLSGKYRFSQFTYPDFGFSFTTHTGMLDFSRAWTRKVSTDVAAGPEWTGGSAVAGVPSALRAFATGSLTYSFRSTSASLIYNRATNGGGGYLIGAETDSLAATLSREFHRSLTVGFHGSYMRTAALGKGGITNGKFAGVQISRRVGPQITFYANYTVTDQSTSSALPGNTLNGMMQMASIGIGYGSKERHIGH
jgi:hypothetical protein